MERESYRHALETAKGELARLLTDKMEVQARIAKLAPVIEYLAVLCDEIPPPRSYVGLPATQPSDLGLTDAIRRAFKEASPRPLSPTEVRDKVREFGFQLDKYANELPPIHNTILRLKKNGEIEEDVPTRDGRVYKWVSSLKRALLEIEHPPRNSMYGLSADTIKSKK